MTSKKRKQRVILGVILLVLISLAYSLFLYKTPQQLAGDAKYIPEFFGLTKSDFIRFDGEMYVVDELHSQGREWGDFGSAHYEIRLCELHPNIRREIEEKGGIDTDSTWVLTRIRGNIRGKIVVRHNSSKAYVHYYQIYDD